MCVSPYRKGEDVENGWIKCSDRLPEFKHKEDYSEFGNGYDVSDKVLAIDSEEGIVIAEYVRPLDEEEDPTHWEVVNADIIGDREITHWMPLPEPPLA
jgi:hypothetical protein